LIQDGRTWASQLVQEISAEELQCPFELDHRVPGVAKGTFIDLLANTGRTRASSRCTCVILQSKTKEASGRKTGWKIWLRVSEHLSGASPTGHTGGVSAKRAEAYVAL